MLLSVGVAFGCYYALMFVIGILVNLANVEGYLVVLAAIGFVSGYYARSNAFVFRLCMWVGGISTAIVLVEMVLLPMLQGSGKGWVIIISVLSAVITYIVTRRLTFNRWVRRDPTTGLRPDPPLGREYLRWVFAFLI